MAGGVVEPVNSLPILIIGAPAVLASFAYWRHERQVARRENERIEEGIRRFAYTENWHAYQEWPWPPYRARRVSRTEER